MYVLFSLRFLHIYVIVIFLLFAYLLTLPNLLPFLIFLCLTYLHLKGCLFIRILK